MTCADEFQTLSPTLYHWSAYDPEVKCELCSTGFRAPNGLVVVDPIPLSDAAWQELFEQAPLRAILLTNGNHVRHAVELRQKYQVPVVTAPATRKDITELKPDVILLEHELLYGISPICIPGATLGETAFLSRAGELALGDAVIHVSTEKGLEFLPDKYCFDAEQNRASIRKLLNFDFHTLTFAHGLPITSGAKERLAELLDR
jgi:hypothetical protein